jgi:hypothetical protein
MALVIEKPQACNHYLGEEVFSLDPSRGYPNCNNTHNVSEIILTYKIIFQILSI